MTVQDTLSNQAKLREIYLKIEKLQGVVERLYRQAAVLDELLMRGG